MSRELLQQALDALNTCVRDYDYDEELYQTFDVRLVNAAAAALKAALAKPEQEPVAWMTNSEHEYSIEYKFNWLQTPLHDIPLYTAPLRKEWVGLTDKEIFDADNAGQGLIEFARAIEGKLKEKNGAL